MRKAIDRAAEKRTVDEGTRGGNDEEEGRSGEPQSEPLPSRFLLRGQGKRRYQPCLSRLTLGATVPGTTLGAASVAGVGGTAAYARLAIKDALAETLCVGRTARAVSDAVGTARRSAEVAGTPRERVAARSQGDQYRNTIGERSAGGSRVRTEMFEGHDALFWER